VGTLALGVGLLAASPAVAQFDSFLDKARESLERRLGKELDKQINPDDHAQPAPPQSQTPETVPNTAPQTRSEPAPAPPPLSGDVASIQQNLNALGYDAGPVDGLMGSRTRAAIRAWQRDAGLRETGQPSRAVQRQLERTVASQNAQPPSPMTNAPFGGTSSGGASGGPPQFSLAQPTLEPSEHVRLRVNGRTPSGVVLWAHVVERGQKPAGHERGQQVINLQEHKNVILRTPGPGAYDVLVLDSGSREMARLPITVAGEIERPALAPASGGIVAQINGSSPQRIVVRANNIRHELAGIEPDATGDRLDTMLARVAAGVIQDPADWGGKIYEFFPILTPSERQDILTGALSDRPIDAYRQGETLFGYFASKNWLPDRGLLETHLSGFETRRLERAMIQNAWPKIAARSIDLPLRVRLFCSIRRPEYNFEQEVWYFSQVVPGKGCMRINQGDAFRLQGRVAFDAFKLDVPISPDEAEKLYNTLQSDASPRANGFDIVEIDITINDITLSGQKVAGLALNIKPDQASVEAIKLYGDATLDPMALEFSRESSGQRESPPMTLADARVGSRDLVEIRRSDLLPTSPVAVQYVCLKRQDLPSSYYDTARYRIVAAQPLSLQQAGQALGRHSADAFVTTGECLKWLREQVALYGAMPATFSVYRKQAGQGAPQALPADASAGSSEGGADVVAAQFGETDLVELRWRGLSEGARVRVEYACLDRKTVPDAYKGGYPYSLAGKANNLAMASHLLAAHRHLIILITTGSCVPVLRDKLNASGIQPEDYRLTKIGSTSAR
jgi:hypothetical protein